MPIHAKTYRGMRLTSKQLLEIFLELPLTDIVPLNIQHLTQHLTLSFTFRKTEEDKVRISGIYLTYI